MYIYGCPIEAISQEDHVDVDADVDVDCEEMTKVNEVLEGQGLVESVMGVVRSQG